MKFSSCPSEFRWRRFGRSLDWRWWRKRKIKEFIWFVFLLCFSRNGKIVCSSAHFICFQSFNRFIWFIWRLKWERRRTRREKNLFLCLSKVIEKSREDKISADEFLENFPLVIISFVCLSCNVLIEIFTLIIGCWMISESEKIFFNFRWMFNKLIQ